MPADVVRSEPATIADFFRIYRAVEKQKPTEKPTAVPAWIKSVDEKAKDMTYEEWLSAELGMPQSIEDSTSDGAIESRLTADDKVILPAESKVEAVSPKPTEAPKPTETKVEAPKSPATTRTAPPTPPKPKRDFDGELMASIDRAMGDVDVTPIEGEEYAVVVAKSEGEPEPNEDSKPKDKKSLREEFKSDKSELRKKFKADMAALRGGKNSLGSALDQLAKMDIDF
jgi:hypothetical protein